MHTVVDRIIRVFINRRVLLNEPNKSAPEDAAGLAIELLETYRSRLARQTLSAASHSTR